MGIITLCVVFGSCVQIGSRLKPDAIKEDEGAYFGHVKVLDKGRDITSDCRVYFRNEQNGAKDALGLPKDGWIFRTAEPGMARLVLFICPSSAWSTSNDYGHLTKHIEFEILGKKTANYFGHIEVFLNSKGEKKAAWGYPDDPHKSYKGFKEVGEKISLESHVKEARSEYERRYGKDQKLRLTFNVKEWVKKAPNSKK